MVVEPKVKGFICTTAHPVGCKENVKRQIDYTKKQGDFNTNFKNVLVIGSSTGYGLATRIAAAFGGKANTLGIMFEKLSRGKRTATPGYYNTKAFEEFAKEEGLYAKTLNGDAFSEQMKLDTIDTIKKDMDKIDLVVYSLAAPRRELKDGTIVNSCLKTVGEPFTEKSWNLTSNEISTATIPASTEEEVEGTVKVMGGEDWMDWIQMLKDAQVLSDKVVTVAYSYIGPELTYPVYNKGTIGMAKNHLFQSSKKMNEIYKDQGIKAYVSVNKAVVTQASSAIPIVPLYFSILYKVMKSQNNHEGCIEQMNRLFIDKHLMDEAVVDKDGFIRLDDWEMKPEIQTEVMNRWKAVATDNLFQLADVDGYWEDFYHMFGFRYDNVDYQQDVEIE